MVEGLAMHPLVACMSYLDHVLRLSRIWHCSQFLFDVECSSFNYASRIPRRSTIEATVEVWLARCGDVDVSGFEAAVSSTSVGIDPRPYFGSC